MNDLGFPGGMEYDSHFSPEVVEIVEVGSGLTAKLRQALLSSKQYGLVGVRYLAGADIVDYIKAHESIRDKVKPRTRIERAVHIFPLNTFQSRLRRVSKIIDKDALVVQRLKRTPSIIKKLKRGQTSTMKLSQMQDIGGCRSVLSNVDLAKKLCNEHYHIDKNTKDKHCDIKHHFKNKKDYIANPKDDGYRGIHLIYSYNSDKKNKTYNGQL